MLLREPDLMATTVKPEHGRADLATVAVRAKVNEKAVAAADNDYS